MVLVHQHYKCLGSGRCNTSGRGINDNLVVVMHLLTSFLYWFTGHVGK